MSSKPLSARSAPPASMCISTCSPTSSAMQTGDDEDDKGRLMEDNHKHEDDWTRVPTGRASLNNETFSVYYACPL